MLRWLSALLILLLSSLYFPFHSNIHVLFDDAGTQSSENITSRVLILTAHPDDECLFFAPTVLALQNSQTPPEIYSLTMSIGNADGLGITRRDELRQSLDVLGIDHDRRWVVDHPMLQDNITSQWDPSVIAVVLAPYVVNNHITTILTFDTQGISYHPNHYSLPFGASHLVNTLRSRAYETPSIAVPRVFSLITVPVLPKYVGPLAPLTSRLSVVLETVLSRFIQSNKSPRAIFTSGFKEYVTAIQAMRKHVTQLEWFRYLYVTFSRYMWVNEWVEVDPSDIVTGRT